ncbi:MAG: hypothetical protein MJ061_07185, partial [Mailhella sp.]|nr:hypothetical protein [Mailhella sp.]
MTVGLVYAVTAFVSFLLMALIYSRVRSPHPRQAVDEPYIWMLRTFMLFTLVDTAWGLCYADLIHSVEFFTCVGHAYRALPCGSAFAWRLYVLQSTKEEETVHCWLLLAAGQLLMMQLIALVCNPFGHRVFQVTESAGYVIDSARYLLYFLQYTYYGIVIATCSVLAWRREGEARRRFRETVVYSVVPLCFGVAQYAFFDIAMYSMGFFASALVIYLYRQSITIENPLEAAASR